MEFCLEKSMKYKIQDEIGNHFFDHAVKLVQEGKTFVFVLDNIDWDLFRISKFLGVCIAGIEFQIFILSLHA